MFEPTTLFKRHTDIRYRRLGEEGILVKQTEGEVLALNDVGVRVLELLEIPTSISDLLDTLVLEYAVERATVERDVENYLQKLLAVGVIEQVGT